MLTFGYRRGMSDDEPVPGGRRSRIRAAALAEITDIAGRHLSRDGVEGLSVRSIAREMGMVSSGIYRHVSSRDELLTLLVVDGYRRLADAVEEAVSCHPRSPRRSFLAAAEAVRRIARADPNRHALLYGTPVVGYTAPSETTEAAERLYGALLRPLVAAPARHQTAEGGRADGFDADALRRLAPGLDDGTAVLALDTWAAMFGHVSLELFGHHRGTVTDPDRFFEAAMARHADRLGLTS